MRRNAIAVTFVGFAIFLHGVHVACAASIAHDWNPMSADAIATAYGYLDPLLGWPKVLCLAVAMGLMTRQFWQKVVEFLKNDPDDPSGASL